MGYSSSVKAIILRNLRELSQGNGLHAQLIRGGMGTAGIQVVNRLLALGLGIVLARTLGAEEYGVYAYALAIMSFLMVVAEAGVPTLLMREVATNHGQQRWGLLRGALVRGGQFVLLASSTVSLVGLLVLWLFVEGLSTAQFQTIFLMLLVLPLSALTKTITHAMRGLHRVVVSQAVEMFLWPLLVLVIVGAIFFFVPALRQPQYAMIAQLGAATLVVLTGLGMLCRYLPAETRSQPSEYLNRQWLKSALPFTLIGGAGIINSQADIIILGWFRSAEEVGIYRVATQGGVLVTFILQAAHGVLSPIFARLYGAKDFELLRRLFRTSSVLIFTTSIPLALVFVVFGEPLIRFVFGEQYLLAALPLAVLSIGYLLNIAFGPIGLLLQMTGRETMTAKVLWLTVAVNIFLNFILIPLYGAVGGAVATSVAVVMYHLILRYLAYRELHI